MKELLQEQSDKLQQLADRLAEKAGGVRCCPVCRPAVHLSHDEETKLALQGDSRLSRPRGGHRKFFEEASFNPILRCVKGLLHS